MVDLGVRGFMFALLTRDLSRKGSDSPGGYEFTVFSDLRARAAQQSYGSGDLAIALFIDALNRAKPKGEVPIANLALLVRFRDPNDPTTVDRVDPYNLAASFGAGVKLLRATVEITDDPLTTGIEKKLRWLDHLISLGASLDGDTSSVLRVDAPLARELGPGYFKTAM